MILSYLMIWMKNRLIRIISGSTEPTCSLLTYERTAIMPDPTSQANYLEIATGHVHFDWTVDWEKLIISGAATHTLTAKQEGVDKVMYVPVC